MNDYNEVSGIFHVVYVHIWYIHCVDLGCDQRLTFFHRAHQMEKKLEDENYINEILRI